MYSQYIPPTTQQDILENKERKDYEGMCALNQNGIPGHILIGHGPELEHFERRDIGTTHVMSYTDKLKAPQITDSMNYQMLNTGVDKKHINTRPEDLNPDPNQGRKPRSYAEFTKTCDKNFNKIGLRK